MKSFSFKVLYLSLFVPSILFVLTLPLMENGLQGRLAETIRRQLIQGHADILQGKANLYDEIHANVTAVRKASLAAQLGAQVAVTVQNAQGSVIYPFYDRTLLSLQGEKNLDNPAGPLFNNQGYLVAKPNDSRENLLHQYSDFIEGMRIEVQVIVPTTSWLGGATLLIYIFLTVAALYFYYQRSRRLEEESLLTLTSEMRDQLEIEKRDHALQVGVQLEEAQKRLAEIKTQEEDWLKEVERLEKEKAGLEEELLESMEQSEEQQEKLHSLQEEMVKKGELQEKADAKEAETLSERFAKLYRNLEIDPTAIKGLVHLRNEKSKLQAEEVLKRLNDNDPGLKVRRKIAGVADCDAYELGFGPKGRIYYVRSGSRQYRVVRVGTKTTQNKDLAALKGLSA